MNKEIGKLGEDIAALYLENKGYFVVERNYRKPFGEIDIIVEKKNQITFIEVKSVSRETGIIVSHENPSTSYRPEENVHALKIKRLTKTIEIFLLERGMTKKNWDFAVITVVINQKDKSARVKFIKDIIGT